MARNREEIYTIWNTVPDNRNLQTYIEYNRKNKQAREICSSALNPSITDPNFQNNNLIIDTIYNYLQRFYIYLSDLKYDKDNFVEELNTYFLSKKKDITSSEITPTRTYDDHAFQQRRAFILEAKGDLIAKAQSGEVTKENDKYKLFHDLMLRVLDGFYQLYNESGSAAEFIRLGNEDLEEDINLETISKETIEQYVQTYVNIFISKLFEMDLEKQEEETSKPFQAAQLRRKRKLDSSPEAETIANDEEQEQEAATVANDEEQEQNEGEFLRAAKKQKLLNSQARNIV
jgi:hypothetical protein